MTIAEKFAIETLLTMRDEAKDHGVKIADRELSTAEVSLLVNIIEQYIADYRCGGGEVDGNL